MGSCDGECQAVSACCCSHLVGAKTTNLDFHRINYNKLHINFFYTNYTAERKSPSPEERKKHLDYLVAEHGAGARANLLERNPVLSTNTLLP